MSALFPAPGISPQLAGITRDPMHGWLRQMPLLPPVWDAGVGGREFVAGFVRNHTALWGNVILEDHPLGDTPISCLFDGVDVHDFLVDSHNRPSCDQPLSMDRFPESNFSNRIPPVFTDFVDTEMQSRLDRGCVVKWAEVSSSGPARPRLIMALAVEDTKPRHLFDAWMLNTFCKPINFSVDTVANVAYEGCFMTPLDT